VYVTAAAGPERACILARSFAQFTVQCCCVAVVQLVLLFVHGSVTSDDYTL